MLLFHSSYSMFVASAEERSEASHENWAPNYHHPPSDVDVAGTALHVDVAGTELFIHMHANITDGYNYQRESCTPNLRVSRNRLCCPSPFLDTTPNSWITWKSLSLSGEGDRGTTTLQPKQNAALGMVHILHLNKAGMCQIITTTSKVDVPT